MTLVSTLMQPLRTKYAPKTMDQNEVRPSRYGAWDFFQKQSNLKGGILSDEAKKFIDRSAGNTVVIPVLNADDVEISNVRSCTIEADDETSALVTLTFATYSFGFTMTPARHFNNDIGYQDLFNHKLEQYLLKLAATLDSASVATLDAARNVYWPAQITKYYPQVNNALQVGQDQRNDFFNNLEAILMEMDYYGDVNIIGSTSLQPMLNRLSAQGGGNATNENFQFDLYKWNFTNRLLNGDNVQSTLYTCRDGSVATRNRNTPDNIAKSRIGPTDAPLKEWGEQQMPIVNLNMGTFYTRDCADQSALDGGGARMTQLQRSMVEGFAFDTDICFVTAYNSDPATKFEPITKAEISLADAAA